MLRIGVLSLTSPGTLIRLQPLDSKNQDTAFMSRPYSIQMSLAMTSASVLSLGMPCAWGVTTGATQLGVSLVRSLPHPVCRFLPDCEPDEQRLDFPAWERHPQLGLKQ